MDPGIADVSDLAGSGHFADRGFLIDLPRALIGDSRRPAGHHAGNLGPDEFEAVNITKSKPTVDSERAKQALTRLHPALQKLQES